MNYAPILISVYDRQEHLKRCIDSLLKNIISTKSILYIVSDGTASPQVITKIKYLREYIANINGFKKVIPIFREQNLGSFRSINSAIDYVIEKHGKVIFLEDDNVVSDNFLKFVNDGLSFYQNDPTIFSISGYNYPIKMPTGYRSDIYKWQGYTAWGVGLWRDKWKEIDWSYEEIKRFLSDKRQVKTANRIAEHVVNILKTELNNKKQLPADAIISIHLVKKNMYSIFPVVSKVRNIGHDGTGEHNGITDIYLKQIIDTNAKYTFVEGVETNTRINTTLKKHFRYKLKTKIAKKLTSIKILQQLRKYALHLYK